MDRITERILKSIETGNGRKRFPINITNVVCNGIGKSGARDISWRAETDLKSPAAKTFSLSYDEYGIVSVSCSSEIVVDVSALSGEKLIIVRMELKGGNPDRDVEVVINRAGSTWSTEERFLAGAFIKRWPHLCESVNLLFELGLIVQAAVFEGVTADLVTLVGAQ